MSTGGSQPATGRPLCGRRVVTTRDRPGLLESLLARAGADVVHVPLIEIDEPPGGDGQLARALADLDSFEWLVVTSRHGARRVGAAAAQFPGVRLAAVGARTAADLAHLAGRAPIIVPDRQTGAELVEAMPVTAAGVRALVVQADRADDTVAEGLRRKGFDVQVVVGYSTRLRLPTAAERGAALAADAVAFASGSAAESWVEAFGDVAPPVVVAIGPTTREVAIAAGLQVTHVAADHSIEGLVAEIASVFEVRP